MDDQIQKVEKVRDKKKGDEEEPMSRLWMHYTHKHSAQRLERRSRSRRRGVGMTPGCFIVCSWRHLLAPSPLTAALPLNPLPP